MNLSLLLGQPFLLIILLIGTDLNDWIYPGLFFIKQD